MDDAKTPVYLDDQLVRRAETTAAGHGTNAAELIESAVQRYLDLEDLLATVWARSPDDLSEDESLEYATREVHTMRQERAAAERK